MDRTISWIFVLALAGCSAPDRVLKEPAVDESLKITDGSVALVKGRAIGYQIYTCRDGAFDGAHGEPDAILYGDAGFLAHHYWSVDPAGPAWEAKDGSRIVGKKLDPVQVRDGTIPWLKLQVVAHEGERAFFSRMRFVQRVETTGGVAPGGSCETGARVRVPYTAAYYFFGPRP